MVVRKKQIKHSQSENRPLIDTESGKLDGEIPVDIESVVAAADIGSAEELAAIKMN